MKKLLPIVALSLTCIVGGCAFFGGNSQNAAAKTNARAAYQDFIGKNKTITVDSVYGYNYKNAQKAALKTTPKTINLKKYTHYVYKDLNHDGTPELIVTNSKKASIVNKKYLICSFRNGKVVPELCVSGVRSGLYTAKNNSLCIGFGSSTDETYVFTKMTKNGLKYTATYRHTYYHVAGGKMVNKYYKTGVKVKKAVFTNAKKKIQTRINL